MVQLKSSFFLGYWSLSPGVYCPLFQECVVALKIWATNTHWQRTVSQRKEDLKWILNNWFDTNWIYSSCSRYHEQVMEWHCHNFRTSRPINVSERVMLGPITQCTIRDRLPYGLRLLVICDGGCVYDVHIFGIGFIRVIMPKLTRIYFSVV